MQVFTRNRNHALAVAMTRHRLRVEARRKGYSPDQVNRLMRDVSNKTILDRLKEFWAEHGDTIMAILKVVFMILPMFLAKEPPELQPVDTVGMDAIEMEEAQGEWAAQVQE